MTTSRSVQDILRDLSREDTVRRAGECMRELFRLAMSLTDQVAKLAEAPYSAAITAATAMAAKSRTELEAARGAQARAKEAVQAALLASRRAPNSAAVGRALRSSQDAQEAVGGAVSAFEAAVQSADRELAEARSPLKALDEARQALMAVRSEYTEGRDRGRLHTATAALSAALATVKSSSAGLAQSESECKDLQAAAEQADRTLEALRAAQTGLQQAGFDSDVMSELEQEIAAAVIDKDAADQAASAYRARHAEALAATDLYAQLDQVLAALNSVATIFDERHHAEQAARLRQTEFDRQQAESERSSSDPNCTCGPDGTCGYCKGLQSWRAGGHDREKGWGD